MEDRRPSANGRGPEEPLAANGPSGGPASDAPQPNAAEDRTSVSHIRQRLFGNSALMLACNVATIAVSLVSVPIIVGTLGLDGYGVWESILAVSFLSMIFQASVSGTLLWRISAAYGANDPAEARRLVRLGTAASLAFFLLIVPPVWFLRGPLVHLLSVPPAFAESAAWILPAVVAMMILGGVHESLGAVLGGYQRAGLGTLIRSGQMVVFHSISIAGLLSGWGLWSMLVGFVGGSLFSLVAYYVTASRTCGRINLLPAAPARRDLETIPRYASMLFVGNVSGALRDQADKVILAAVAGSAWTGLYGIAVRLGSLVLMVSTLFYAPLTAAAGALHAAGNWQGVRRLYSNVITVLAVCGGAVAVVVGGVYDRILVVWMGRDIPEVGFLLFVVLFGNTAAVMLTGAGTALCRGVGRAGIDAGYTVFSLASNIFLKVVLIAAFGAMGSVVSSSLSWAMAGVVFVVLMHRCLDLPREATRRAFICLGLTALVILATRHVCALLPDTADRLSALWSGAAIGTVAAGVYFALAVMCGAVSLQTLRKVSQRVSARLLSARRA